MKRLIMTVSALVALAVQIPAQEAVRDSLHMAGVRVSSTDGSPFSTLDVAVRGVNSLHGDGSPLWIVDGVILNTAISHNLNPFWQYGDVGYATASDPLPYISACDIESVRVLKDVSATAIYGSKGANGVILVTTRKASVDKTSIRWSSDMSVAEPTHSGYARPAVSHRHNVSAGAVNDRTSYMLSGSFRDDRYLLPGMGARSGGLRVSFETKANQVVSFGLNSILSAGMTSSAASTAPFGALSQTIAMRDRSADLQAWTEDYDDDALDFRAVTSAWLTIRPFRGFSADIRLGTDYRSNTRSFWYGNGTDFGKSVNGAASILVSSLFSYNASLRLSYARYFAEKHHFIISAGAEALGDWNKMNNQSGTDFFLHDLRAKSINVMADRARIHYYEYDNLTAGADVSASYVFDSLVGMTVSLRADSNPRLDGPGMVLYPAGQAWWDIRRTFLNSSRVLSSLKLKGGYGEAGYDHVMPYGLSASFVPASGWRETISADHVAFHEVRSRLHTKEFNVGMEAGFLDERLSLETAFFDRRTKDMLTLYSFGESGEGHSFDMANRGVELGIRAVPVSTGSWKWTLDMNGTYHLTNNMEVVIRDYRNRPIGNPVPDVYGSLGTLLSWKDIELDILFDGAAGHDIVNMNRMYANGTDKVSGRYLEDGDFLRVARISLAYDLHFRKVTWVDSLKFRAGVRNLCTLTRYSGWNPDVNSFASSNSTLGMDYGSHQMARCWTLGIHVIF